MGVCANLEYVRPSELCNPSFSFGIAFKVFSVVGSVLTPLILDQLLGDINDKTETGEGNVLLYLAYAGSIMFSEIANGISAYLILRGVRPSRSVAARQAIEYIYQLPHSEFANIDTGKLINITVDNSYSAIGDFVKEGMEILTVPLKLGGISTVISILYSEQTGLIFLIASLGYALAAYTFNKWALSGPADQYTKAQTNFRERLQEMVVNVETTQFFDAGDREKDKFENIQKNFEESFLTLEARREIVLKIIQNITVFGIILGVTWYTGNATKNENTAFDVGDFVAINAFLIQFIFQLSNFITSVGKFSEANTKMTHPIEFCKQAKAFLQKIPTPELVEVKVDGASQSSSGQPVAIEFLHFSLSFKTKISDSKIQVRPIFNKANFVIKKGEKVAIVGATASGKSTIVRLLTRVFEPISTDKYLISGDILVAGKSVTRYARSELHSLIGVVPQKTVLFAGTWRENLLYGVKRPVEDKELAAIVQLSLLANVVPKDYDEKIPIAKLSGGEQQRIGLARLIAMKPPIILLDESTSALDGDTEARFLTQFYQWIDSNRSVYNPTVVTITHRLSSVCNVERVLVLNNGNLNENGSPITLARDEKTTYSRLIKLFPCQDPSHQLMSESKKPAASSGDGKSISDFPQFSVFTALQPFNEDFLPEGKAVDTPQIRDVRLAAGGGAAAKSSDYTKMEP